MSVWTCVISQEHVLTVEHCIQNLILEYIRVTDGSVDLRLGRKYKVSYWLTFDDWAYENNEPPVHDTNDVTVLKVKY